MKTKKTNPARILITLFAAALFLALAALATGCEAKLGERCDGFFKNTCKAPASCVKTSKGKVCANSCSAGNKCQKGLKLLGDNYISPVTTITFPHLTAVC